MDRTKQLESFPLLIQGLDHLRAGKYFDSERLSHLIQDTAIAGLIETMVPDWGDFIRQYDSQLAPSRWLTRVARFLKVFELSVLAAFVTLIGIDLFQPVEWVTRALPGITLFVLLFFGVVYGLTFFFVERPAERYLRTCHAANKKLAKNLHKLVQKLVVTLDARLLAEGLDAGAYGFQLCAKDYPGIFVTIRPGRITGDRLFRAVPYPLHTVYAEDRSRINVLMDSYRDDRLLRSLADLENKAQVNMVATSNISDHDVFRKASRDILHKHPRSTIMIIPPERGRKVVAVFTVDGTWHLSFGKTLRPSELKYMPVKYEAMRMDFKERFNRGLSEGSRYRPD